MGKNHKVNAGMVGKPTKLDMSRAATLARTAEYLRRNRREIEAWWSISVEDDPVAQAALEKGGVMVGPKAPRRRRVSDEWADEV